MYTSLSDRVAYTCGTSFAHGSYISTREYYIPRKMWGVARAAIGFEERI